MYYRTPGNLNPILPREEITPTNIADNFDESTVIISKTQKMTKMLPQSSTLIQSNIT